MEKNIEKNTTISSVNNKKKECSFYKVTINIL